MKLCPVCNSQLPDNQEVPELVPLDYHEDALALSIKRRIAAEEKLRWIPVSERLPEKNGQYLVYSGWVRTLLCLYGEWACDPKESPVTHWMPLPSPPDEVE